MDHPLGSSDPVPHTSTLLDVESLEEHMLRNQTSAEESLEDVENYITQELASTSSASVVLDTEHNNCGSDDDDDSSSDSSDDDENQTQIGLSVGKLYRMMTNGENPREIIRQLFGISEAEIEELRPYPDSQLWRMLFESISRRQKLRQYNTIVDAVELIQKSNKIIVLTGAGISVSCGIPDFRSPNGIYSRLEKDFPEMKDPIHMFNINFFRNNPQPFFSFAKELYPGKFVPSVTHRFIKEIEKQGKLLRNYTQNIDTLEKIAGLENVVLCHGSFAKATCLVCKHSVDADFIKTDVLQGRIPKCHQCPEPVDLSIYKPDIVFFGEDLPKEYYSAIERDKKECDLLIVIGTSLKVHPVAGIPRIVAGVPQIIINREPVGDHKFDIELLGDADVVTQQLSHLLGWMDVKMPSFRPLNEISREAAREQYRITRNPDPITPEDYGIVALRDMFDSRNMESNDCYMFVPPSRYVFPGGLVLEKDRDRRGPRFGFEDNGSSSSSDEDERTEEHKEPVASEPSNWTHGKIE